jgi:hypothetical protein
MASPSDAIFDANMADFLTNPVDIYFGSILAESTTRAACLVIENTATTSFQHAESDMLRETNPHTPRDLIARLDRVESMLSKTIKVFEGVKHSRRTTSPPRCMPLGLQNAAHAASDHMRKKIQIQSGSTTNTC